MVFKYGDYTRCSNCNSTNVVLVKRIFRNGAVNYQYECFDCGENSGSVKTETIPQEVIDNCPDFDPSIKEQRQEREHAEWLLRAEQLSNDKQKQRQEFLDWLNEYYYPSPEWQYRRIKRLEYNKKYFGGKCERCRKNDATLVHHRSYAVLDGMEHTFDLEALCEDCHKMLHPHLRDE